MRIHPACKLIPEMDPSAFAELKADIESAGLQVPIELLNGQIIDGRHRYRACAELGIEPDCVEVTLGDQTAKEYVWRLNGIRRQLTPSQKATIALELKPEKAKQAKQRQGKRQSTQKHLGNNSQKPEPKRARDEAAAEVGVNPRYVDDAENIKKADPQLFAEVREGKKSIPRAKQELASRNKSTQVGAANSKLFKALEDVNAIVSGVWHQHGSIARMMATKEWDDKQNGQLLSLIDALIETLEEWRNECRNRISKSK